MKVISSAILALCLCTPTDALANQKEKQAMAPLPIAMTQVSKIFILNGGGTDAIYDQFYSEMKAWRRYELVDSPEKAQLVFEISFGSQGEVPQVYTNPGNMQTYSYTVNRLRLAVVDQGAKKAIWTAVETPEGARLEKNVQKNRVRAVSRIVENLKKRLAVTR